MKFMGKKIREFCEQQWGLTAAELLVYIAVSSIVISATGLLFSRITKNVLDTQIRAKFQNAETKVQIFGDFCMSLYTFSKTDSVLSPITRADGRGFTRALTVAEKSEFARGFFVLNATGARIDQGLGMAIRFHLPEGAPYFGVDFKNVQPPFSLNYNGVTYDLTQWGNFYSILSNALYGSDVVNGGLCKTSKAVTITTPTPTPTPTPVGATPTPTPVGGTPTPTPDPFATPTPTPTPAPTPTPTPTPTPDPLATATPTPAPGAANTCVSTPPPVGCGLADGTFPGGYKITLPQLITISSSYAGRPDIVYPAGTVVYAGNPTAPSGDRNYYGYLPNGMNVNLMIANPTFPGPECYRSNFMILDCPENLAAYPNPLIAKFTIPAAPGACNHYATFSYTGTPNVQVFPAPATVAPLAPAECPTPPPPAYAEICGLTGSFSSLIAATVGNTCALGAGQTFDISCRNRDIECLDIVRYDSGGIVVTGCGAVTSTGALQAAYAGKFVSKMQNCGAGATITGVNPTDCIVAKANPACEIKSSGGICFGPACITANNWE